LAKCSSGFNQRAKDARTFWTGDYTYGYTMENIELLLLLFYYSPDVGQVPHGVALLRGTEVHSPRSGGCHRRRGSIICRFSDILEVSCSFGKRVLFRCRGRCVGCQEQLTTSCNCEGVRASEGQLRFRSGGVDRPCLVPRSLVLTS
jgi:hypothetical protein